MLALKLAQFSEKTRGAPLELLTGTSRRVSALVRRGGCTLGLRYLSDARIMEVDSLSAQKRLVEAGLGVALLPRSSVHQELEAGSLSIIPAPGIATTLPIVLIHRRSGYLSPAAHTLIEILETTWKRGVTTPPRGRR